MWLVSTFEKIYFKKIFFVSTFLDWYRKSLISWNCVTILLFFLRITLHILFICLEFRYIFLILF